MNRRVVRFESYLGSQSSTSRLHAIWLISLRAFQTFLPDWPDFTVTPAWIRTLYPTSTPKRIAPAHDACQRPDGRQPPGGEPILGLGVLSIFLHQSSNEALDCWAGWAKSMYSCKAAKIACEPRL